jgi:hypothetical protein
MKAPFKIKCTTAQHLGRTDSGPGTNALCGEAEIVGRDKW